jgi:hypothetical protein
MAALSVRMTGSENAASDLIHLSMFLCGLVGASKLVQGESVVATAGKRMGVIGTKELGPNLDDGSVLGRCLVGVVEQAQCNGVPVTAHERVRVVGAENA